MEEKHILLVAIVVSIAGLIGLLILSMYAQPRIVSVSNITQNMLGDVVCVCGHAENISISENAMFFDLVENGGRIAVVFFDVKLAEKVTENTNICIDGEISLYKQKLEIIGRGIV